MSVVSEILKCEPDGSLSFGNYLIKEKQKKDNVILGGDTYKVKTHNEITRLEKNAVLFLETVPGSAVHNFRLTEKGAAFTAEGAGDTQITLGLSPDTQYNITINGSSTTAKSGKSGKLSFSVILSDKTEAEITIEAV